MRTYMLIMAALFICTSAQANERSDALVAARGAYAAGEYTTCAAQYEKAIALGGGSAEIHYDCASCYARAGQLDRAFVHLIRAIAFGYHEPQWLEFDPDLQALHTHPQWPTIVDQCRQALADYLATVNAELYHMMQQDQADRMTEDIDWDTVVAHDRMHRTRVRQLLDSGLVRTADDYFHAAMIFQHGEDSTAYRFAHHLATKAVELDSTHNSARWLAAASWDRYLWSMGKSQWYGTQSILILGKWTLEPLDRNAVTDEERAKWRVPPLAESLRRIKLQNKAEAGKDTTK